MIMTSRTTPNPAQELPASVEVQYLRARNADLEETVASLKAELGRMVDAERFAAWFSAYSLSPSQARIFAVLHRRRGHIATYETLWNALYGDSDGPDDPGTLKVLVCQLRRHLPSGAILNVPEVGYSLSPIGMAAADEPLTECMGYAA